MIYSASQAGKAVGKSTTTITRAIEKGRISAVKDDNGAWQIDASELYRVFAPASPASPPMQRDAKLYENRDVEAELARVSEKLRVTETHSAQMIERLTDEVADLRRRLDAEAEERRKLSARLLASPPAPPQEPPASPQGPAADTRPLSFLRWLRGR